MESQTKTRWVVTLGAQESRRQGAFRGVADWAWPPSSPDPSLAQILRLEPQLSRPITPPPRLSPSQNLHTGPGPSPTTRWTDGRMDGQGDRLSTFAKS